MVPLSIVICSSFAARRASAISWAAHTGHTPGVKGCIRHTSRVIESGPAFSRNSAGVPLCFESSGISIGSVQLPLYQKERRSHNWFFRRAPGPRRFGDALGAKATYEGLDIGSDFVQEVLTHSGKPPAFEFRGALERMRSERRLVEKSSGGKIKRFSHSEPLPCRISRSAFLRSPFGSVFRYFASAFSRSISAALLSCFVSLFIFLSKFPAPVPTTLAGRIVVSSAGLWQASCSACC